jgi:hypothetical protein
MLTSVLSRCFGSGISGAFLEIRKNPKMRTEEPLSTRPSKRSAAWLAVISTCLLFTNGSSWAGQNLLKNPGFEELAPEANNPPNWTTRADGAGRILLADSESHAGKHGVSIPANTSVEQSVESLPAGAYVARCWVKSQAAQPVTFLLQDPARPWAAYNCVETKVAPGQWVQLEAFCDLDCAGSLTLTLGGMSKEFRLYHGTGGEMGSPIIADDFELTRYKPNTPELRQLGVWDSKQEVGPAFDWSAKDRLSAVDNAAHDFLGTAVIQDRHLVGAIRRSDGGLAIYSMLGGRLKPRCVVVPSPILPAGKCSLVHGTQRTGIRVSSETGDRSYTAWFTPKGVVSIEATQVSKFQVRDCRLRYGLLPSFAGTDICYAPAKMPGTNQFRIPSTQWFVGLGDGGESMLVAVWETDSQAVSLGLSGEGQTRLIDSLTIDTKEKGFSLSYVEHDRLWHEESLKEDWLGEYVPITWKRPFNARWMTHFFVTSGRPSFREPYMGYSFPMAYAKTKMWGVWFEDWNHYPCFFDGPLTMLHFEKTFIPNGEALIYFLEPAAADLFSPCEIVEEVLGLEKAAALFDFDANQLRKLKYSTADKFMYDRPVCATTTRLSKIKKDEKATVGVDLATHLFEFIREIRGRVDQYAAYFDQMRDYLASEEKNHPELRNYLAELQRMVGEAQSKTQEIYDTPLPEVEKKIDSMKALLREGKGDGFECGKLDVRDTAGSQDDLCRRYNRLVLRLTQTAASKCGDSEEKAVIAKYVWDQSRNVVRRPTRWESRRTLYFFEP